MKGVSIWPSAENVRELVSAIAVREPGTGNPLTLTLAV